VSDRPVSVVVNELYDSFKRAEAEVAGLNEKMALLRECIESAIDDPVRALFFLENVSVTAGTAEAYICWLPNNLLGIVKAADELLDAYEDEDARRQFEIDEQRRLVEVSKEFI